jgi:hypothetical protein
VLADGGIEVPRGWLDEGQREPELIADLAQLATSRAPLRTA